MQSRMHALLLKPNRPCARHAGMSIVIAVILCYDEWNGFHVQCCCHPFLVNVLFIYLIIIFKSFGGLEVQHWEVTLVTEKKLFPIYTGEIFKEIRKGKQSKTTESLMLSMCFDHHSILQKWIY